MNLQKFQYGLLDLVITMFALVIVCMVFAVGWPLGLVAKIYDKFYPV